MSIASAQRRLDAVARRLLDEQLQADAAEATAAVDVGGADDPRLAALDRLDRRAQTMTPIQRHPTGDVDLLVDGDQRPPPHAGSAQRYDPAVGPGSAIPHDRATGARSPRRARPQPTAQSPERLGAGVLRQ